MCISPGRATALVFDAPLLPESLELEDQTRFLLVEPGRRGILLVPSEALRPGERLKLTIQFADDAAPASAEFLLVVHAVRGARQEEENVRLHGALSRATTLVGLHSSGLVNEWGISTRSLSRQPQSLPDSALRLRELFSQRAARRVAVIADLENLDAARPWMTRSAKLTVEGSDGAHEDLEVLDLWPPEPIPPGGARRLFIEARATPRQALGVYTLTLSDTDGLRSVTLRGVTFPELAPPP